MQHCNRFFRNNLKLNITILISKHVKFRMDAADSIKYEDEIGIWLLVRLVFITLEDAIERAQIRKRTMFKSDCIS